MARTDRARRGAALATMLLVMVALTILVTAAAARAGVERGSGDDERAQMTAYAAAKSGLQRAQQEIAGLTPAAIGTTWTRSYSGFAGGATVTVRTDLISREGEPAGPLFLMTATGALASGNGTDRRIPPARRSISQLITRGQFDLDSPSALVGLGGVRVTEGASRFTGIDQCTVGTPAPTIAGIAVPNPPAPSAAGGLEIPNASVAITGDPNGAARVMNAVTMAPVLDWNAVQAASVFAPRFRLTSTGAFIGLAPRTTDRYTTIRRDGDLDIGASAAAELAAPPAPAVLVVTGDLTIDRNWTFNGLVLVGGRLQIQNGRQVTIDGSVWTGLDALAGEVVNSTRLLGQVRMSYDHCVLDSIAVRQGGGLGPIASTLYDAAPVP